MFQRRPPSASAWQQPAPSPLEEEGSHTNTHFSGSLCPAMAIGFHIDFKIIGETLRNIEKPVGKGLYLMFRGEKSNAVFCRLDHIERRQH
jgi:hypothetical protein